MLEENKMRIKLILLGDIGVGKTSIIQRYHKDIFNVNNESTFETNFIEKELKLREKEIIIELWDTVSQELYRSMNKIFIKYSKIVILVYDVTSKKSFESLRFWYDFINKEIGSKAILGLVGNKKDLIIDDNYNEEISSLEGEEYASKIGATFALISAKESSIEIKELINKLIIKYFDTIENIEYHSESIIIDKKSFSMAIHKRNECCLSNNNNRYRIKSYLL